ncbi:MAG: PfkB family carbohydrate kinase, partial [Kineosporiaceae bacterium]
MARALVIGEALVDVVVGADGRDRGRHPGGSPANVAAALGRLEHEVRLLTWLADDDDGRLVTRHLEDSGVLVLPAGLRAERTSIARAALDAHGVATYDFDLDWQVRAHDAEEAAGPLGVDVVHTGSIAAVLPPGSSGVEAMLERLIGRATITYDPNARPALMGEPDLTLARMVSYLEIADVIKVSDEDLAWLYPGVSALDVADSWLMQGPSLVVVTHGDRGADVLSRSGPVHVDAVPVDVVDTVGAGDAFTAGLVDALAAEHLLGASRRPRLRTVDQDTLSRVLSRAAGVA